MNNYVKGYLVKINLEEFSSFLHYCRELKYEEKPDYKLIKNHFLNGLKKRNQSLIVKYDWCYPDIQNSNPRKERALSTYHSKSSIYLEDDLLDKKKKEN